MSRNRKSDDWSRLGFPSGCSPPSSKVSWSIHRSSPSRRRRGSGVVEGHGTLHPNKSTTPHQVLLDFLEKVGPGPYSCFFCGGLVKAPSPDRTIESFYLHRIDGDHSNNVFENLAVVHRGCHNRHHGFVVRKALMSEEIRQKIGLSLRRWRSEHYPLDPHGLVQEFLGRCITTKAMCESETRLQSQWYASYERDFSIYAGPDCLLWLLQYQKLALRTVSLATTWIQKNISPVERILDHGAGLGFTSVALAQAFPDAQVIATNYPGLQCDFNEFLLRRAGVRNLKFSDSDSALASTYDVVFAIEVFEHFKEPTAELDRLLGTNPAVLVDTTSFTVKSPGHFDVYLMDGVASRGYRSKEASVKFSDRIRKSQYCLGFSFYNQRPRLWIRCPEANS